MFPINTVIRSIFIIFSKPLQEISIITTITQNSKTLTLINFSDMVDNNKVDLILIF